jgi:hypothetical protein
MSEENWADSIEWYDRFDKGKQKTLEPIWYVLACPDLAKPLWRIAAGYDVEGRTMNVHIERVVCAILYGTEEEAKEAAQMLCDLANARRSV